MESSRNPPPLRLIFLLAFALGAEERATLGADSLSLGDFLKQVSSTNPSYRASETEQAGSTLMASQADLLFKPQAFTNLQYVYDPRETHAPAIEGNTHIQRNFSLGVREQTSFGLQGQLSLDFNQETLLGADSGLVTRPSLTNIYPVPVFSLSLWQNFGGRSVRANQKMLEAQTRAQVEGSRFSAKAVLAQAEGAYWKLAVVREAIRLQKLSAERAEALYALEEAKARKRLIDRDDLLVGEAAVVGKDLELKSYAAEERGAALAFNADRAIQGEDVPEQLELPDPDSILKLQTPARKETSGAVKSAEQQMIAESAGYDMARDKLLPEFNAYGSIFAVGLTLTVPIDQGAVSDARNGYAMRSQAAELNYRKKLEEDESHWADLAAKHEELKDRLRLAVKLEAIQKKKFEAARSKRSKGLGVSEQAFQAELDFVKAAQLRLQLMGELLGVRAEMRLYGGDTGA
jgi:outer membrane protein TolC